MSRKDHIKQLVINYNRRLEKLKEEQSLHGLDTVPKTLIEIEDIETELRKLQEELEILEKEIKKTPEDIFVSDYQQPAEDKALVVQWPPGSPSVDVILGGANHSILLVGTSNFRMVHDDLFHYRDWLEKDQRRILGLLILNPHSPHAFHRERKDVQRSREKDIVKALRAAQREFKHNQRFIPAVYDGPYRYSARAVDIGHDWQLPTASINIISSSHSRGTSAGFHIHFKSSKDSAPFSFYRNELLDIWKAAQANPPGHGISLVSRWSTPSENENLENMTCDLLKQFKLPETDYHIFLPDQLHLTLTSLCRTQKEADAAPLCIDSNDKTCYLPAHFPEYIIDVVQTLLKFTNNLEFEFNQLVLDKQGYIILGTESNVENISIKVMNDFKKSLSSIIDQFNKQFPTEQWDQRLESGVEYRFRPKFANYLPHVTMGRAFDCRSNLPVPLTLDHDRQIRIPTPIKFVINRGSIVHYAYRTLLRCVGEIPINLADPFSLTPNEITRLLRL